MGSNLQSGQELAAYRLEKKLGAGAFAEVWLARETGSFGFSKLVALKVLTDRAGEDEARFESLVNEARVCGHLHHPHIVDVYGVAQAEGLRFIAMEYVQGVPLDVLLRTRERLGLDLPHSVVVDIGIHIAQALTHAHEARDADGTPLAIVHRDLKPANILMSVHGGAKVADFGIAKATSNVAETATGTLKGTPSYVAPEIWTGAREFLPRVDLFALGAILWELVLGRRLFGGESIPALAGQALHGNADEEASVLAERFPELAPIVRRLIERDPTLRTQSAREVETALALLRRSVPASAPLGLFLELFGIASGHPALSRQRFEDLSLPPTELPGWTELIRAAATGGPGLGRGRQGGVSADIPDTDILPSTGSPLGRAESRVAASGSGPFAVASEGRRPVPATAVLSASGADDSEPPVEKMPAAGTESVVMPTRTQLPWRASRRRPLTVSLVISGGLLLGGLAVLLWPGGDKAPEAAATVPFAPEAAATVPFEDLVPVEVTAAVPPEVTASLAPSEPVVETLLPADLPPLDRTPSPVAAVAVKPVKAIAPPRPAPSRPAPSEEAPAVQPVAEVTPEPTPAAVAPSKGEVVFQSSPGGANVWIDGIRVDFRAQGGTSQVRSFEPRTIKVGMGSGDAVDAEISVQVEGGVKSVVRCDIAATLRCTVR